MYGGNLYNGVNKKIFAQATQLYRLGINFSLVLIGGINNSYPEFKFIQYIPLYKHYFPETPFVKRFYRQYLAKQYIKNCIANSGSDTILYLRYPLPLLLLPHELTTRRKCKIIFEFNSIEIHEQRKRGSFLSYYKELLLGNGFRKRCDGIVGVTDEITQYQLKRSGNFNKRHITIGNGIDVNSVPVRELPADDGQNLNIICVADVTFWHGIDRLIKGIAEYKGGWNIQLNIVGGGDEIPNLKNLASRLRINDHVNFHGFVHGNELDRLFEQNHIAVGSLGIHRIGLNQLSILKAREYCARGIPYIIACSDPDFPEDFPYILRLPADDSPIDMELVLLFSSKICHDIHHSQNMRQYARDNLDWSVKMKKLKGFLEDLPINNN